MCPLANMWSCHVYVYYTRIYSVHVKVSPLPKDVEVRPHSSASAEQVSVRVSPLPQHVEEYLIH